MSREFEYNISIDKEIHTPLYIQLFEQFKYYILNEIIKEDTKLPSIRKLATYLNINSSTVVNAYKLLEENRLAYKKVGSGTFVMYQKGSIEAEIIMPAKIDEDIIDVNRDSKIIDFSSATPETGLFPISDFKKIVNTVLERDGGEAFAFQNSKGYKPLRQSICSYMIKNGVRASSEDINIISGAQQGIDIISKVMLSYGDYVYVESPTYLGAIAVFKSRGARIISIPLLEDGLDINELEENFKKVRPKFIYIMPNFQNPTGYSYSERKKRHLLLLCKKYGVMIVEDDYLSDLSYLSKESLPLKAFDKEDRVIYIKSFSKIFMPGLRLAYLIIPKYLKEKITNMKYMTDISTSGFMQRILDEYFREGFWEKHIDYMKKEYSIRYYEAVRASRKCLRGVSFKQPNGGLNLWIKLPERVNSELLLDRCKKNNVIFTPGTAFVSNSEGRRYIRLSFASVKSEKIMEGISIIGTEIEEIKS